MAYVLSTIGQEAPYAEIILEEEDVGRVQTACFSPDSGNVQVVLPDGTRYNLVREYTTDELLR